MVGCTGSTVDGALKGREGYPAVPAEPMATAEQVRLLTDADVPGAMRMSSYRAVVHDAALPSTIVRAATGRLTDSTSPCYAELIADDVFFQQDVVSGRYLRTLYRFRFFGASDRPESSFGTWAQTRLQSFPASEPEGEDAALAEVRAAYLRNIAEFAGHLHKPRKTRR